MKTMHSQHGEDAILDAFFGGKRGGYFVEVGALDGVTFSNTFHLETALGWHGVLIEANPEQAAKSELARPNSTVVAAAVGKPSDAGTFIDLNIVEGYEALSAVHLGSWSRHIVKLVNRNRSDADHLSFSKKSVQLTTIDHILAGAGTPHDFDFMSIDIEGYEWEALQGFSLGEVWRPRVFLIENATGFLPFAIARYLYSAGYGYRFSIGRNDWFEPSSRRQCARGHYLSFRANGAYAAKSAVRKYGAAARRVLQYAYR